MPDETPAAARPAVPEVGVPLAVPPVVVNAGVGVHGVGTDHDRFMLPRLWQFHLYGYGARYAVDGVELRIAPGTVSLVPPGTVVDYRYRGRSQHLYAHLALPEPGGDEAQARRVPVVQDAGVEATLLTELFRRAIAGHMDEAASATVNIWAALWAVADLAARTAAPRMHPALEAATEYIEAHLADPMTVGGLARHCGISHNQLTRLFAARYGSTVVAYIRERRMRRAHHLLTASTLPVAAVAAAVGTADLQAFNKTCRRVLGASPRALREAAQEAGAAFEPVGSAEIVR